MNRCPADRSYAMPLTVTIAEYGVSAFRRLTSAFCSDLVLRQCIRPLGGAHMAPGHHGGKRACDLIRRQASIGLLGSPVLAYAGKTVAPFLPFSLADLGGKWVRYMLSLSTSFVRVRRETGKK